MAKTDANIRDIINAVFAQMQNGSIPDNFEVYVFAGQDQGKMTIVDGKMVIEKISDSLTGIAKDFDKKRIIIANEFGMTGIDYQGNFELGQWDAHLMSNADLAQSIKRTGRPIETGGRWDTARILVFNEASYQSQITEFASNQALLNAARDLWSGLRAQDSAGNDIYKIPELWR